MLTRIRTTSAASMATSVPVPIAIPTSALASAGESLTPSPTIATFFFPFWSSWTFATLWEGRTSAKTFLIPTYIQRKTPRWWHASCWKEEPFAVLGERQTGVSTKLIMVKATLASYTENWRATCLWRKNGVDYSPLLLQRCWQTMLCPQHHALHGFWSSTALAIKIRWLKEAAFS